MGNGYLAEEPGERKREVKGASNIISRFWRIPKKHPCVTVSVSFRMLAGIPMWEASLFYHHTGNAYAVEAKTQSDACQGILDEVDSARDTIKSAAQLLQNYSMRVAPATLAAKGGE